MADDQTQALAAKLIAQRQRRSRNLLLGGLAAVFVLFFFCWWVLTQGTSDDPIFQLQNFLEQFNKEAASEDYLPSPPSLTQIKRILTPTDVDAFDDGIAAFEAGNYRKAGRHWWPLAAKYPNIRPSLAQEYYRVAREHSLKNEQKKTKNLLKMAFAFYDKGVRENLLAKKTYKALGDKRIASKYSDLVRLYWPKGKRRKVDPPSPMLTFMFVFVLLLGGLFAYFYWDELALAEKLVFLVAKITGKSSSAPAQEPAGLSVETFPGEAPTPVPSTPKLEAESLNNILAAEGFLKEVRDFFDQKNYELGVDLCQKAIDLNPANAKKVAQICLREGAHLYELSEFKQTRDLLEVSLHYDPHSAEGRTLLGNCSIKLGDYDRAKVEYEKVISITPKNADAYYTLGVCYQKTGDLDRARRSFEVAVKLNKHVNSYFYLAKIAEAKGELERAISDWEAFVSLAKDTPQAASALERLEKLRKMAEQQNQSKATE